MLIIGSDKQVVSVADICRGDTVNHVWLAAQRTPCFSQQRRDVNTFSVRLSRVEQRRDLEKRL